MRIFLPLLLIFLSCSMDNESKDRLQERTKTSDTDSNDTIKKTDSQTKVIEPKKNEKPIYEVAIVDDENGTIQRLFVVISAEKVYDLQFVQTVVCALNKDYVLESKSNISFFTEKKYANYYTKVFKSIGAHIELTPSEEEEYKNWKKSYYLAEYWNDTRDYKTYPSSGISKKMKQFEIQSCE